MASLEPSVMQCRWHIHVSKAIGIVEKYIKTNKGRFTSSVFPPQSTFISYTKSTSSEITHTDFES